MAINGMIFDNRHPTAKSIRNALSNALDDGILNGCSITVSSATPPVITIGSGFIIIAGGVFKIDGSQIVNTTSSASTKNYTRVIAKFTPSRTSTESTFDQIEFSADYSDTIEGFSSLMKGNVNASTVSSDTYYSIEIAIINNSSRTIYRKNSAGPKIKYIDKLEIGTLVNNVRTLEVGTNGYASVESPSGLPDTAKLLSVNVLHWTGNTNHFSLLMYGNKAPNEPAGKPYVYITGPAGTKIYNLQLRYYYV